MNTTSRIAGLAAMVALSGALLAPNAEAQRGGRFPLDYNGRANYGGGTLRTGFTPNP